MNSSTTTEDPDLAELRNATLQEKAAAFEWLRGQACDGEGIRHAAVLMVDIERLRAIERAAWHLLDDSEHRVDVDEVVVGKKDFEAIAALLPENCPHHTAAPTQEGPDYQPVRLPGELHPDTKSLVVRFATALAEKLYAAELKYDYSDGWLYDGWMEECQSSLLEHVWKGDPRDVAAFCAFAWHHGWRTSAETERARNNALRNQALEQAAQALDDQAETIRALKEE